MYMAQWTYIRRLHIYIYIYIYIYLCVCVYRRIYGAGLYLSVLPPSLPLSHPPLGTVTNFTKVIASPALPALSLPLSLLLSLHPSLPLSFFAVLFLLSVD
jgi:hypothetical protein